MTMQHYRILVIDDNPAIHDDFRKVLTPEVANRALEETRAKFFSSQASSDSPSIQFDIDCAEQGQIGHAMVQHAIQKNTPYAVAFVDMRMPPGWDGVETIDQIWKIDPHLQMVICTAYSDHDWEQVLQKLPNHDQLLILRKPFESIEVRQLATSLAKRWVHLNDTRQKLSELAAFQEERATETQEAIQQLEWEAQQRPEQLR